MLCTPGEEWLNFVFLVHSGLWLGLQWQWAARAGEQREPADPVQSGSAAQRLCAPGMPSGKGKCIPAASFCWKPLLGVFHLLLDFTSSSAEFFLAALNYILLIQHASKL